MTRVPVDEHYDDQDLIPQPGDERFFLLVAMLHGDPLVDDWLVRRANMFFSTMNAFFTDEEKTKWGEQYRAATLIRYIRWYSLNGLPDRQEREVVTRTISGRDVDDLMEGIRLPKDQS